MPTPLGVHSAALEVSAPLEFRLGSPHRQRILPQVLGTRNRQQLELQRDALEKAGCATIFTDVASGAINQREGLEETLEFVRQGDPLVVWKLDRLGRSIIDLIERVNELQTRGIGFNHVQETST